MSVYVEYHQRPRAERQFRRMIGQQKLATLAVAIEGYLAFSVTTEEVATLVPA
jgi:hypothetical protein